MKLNFRRIISKGDFIPEIDGLRFIAITSVVLFHLYGFLLKKDTRSYAVSYDFSFLNNILEHGHIGVPLFFVISGFILARPFANMYLAKGSKVSIKHYFLRRLTRLEPPYIAAMTVLLFGAVYVAKVVTLRNGLVSYACSIFYVHNFVYGKDILPFINIVAWSLEIEIQFYILMPILALLFKIANSLYRRLIIIALTIVFVCIDFYEALPFISIINYFKFFLIGILLADFYVSKIDAHKKSKLYGLTSLLLFIAIWYIEMNKPKETFGTIGWEIVQLASIFGFYYLTIFYRSIKLLSNPVVTNIGGMCYSIYLLHFSLMSMFGNPLLRITFSTNALINTTLYSVILLVIVILVSSIFFILIERPCMDKDWYKKLFLWFKKVPA